LKILLYGILTLVLLGIVAAGSAIFWLDTNSFKTHLEKAVEDATGKALIIESVPQISIIPPGFKIGAASWGYKDGKPSQYGVSVAIKSSSLSIELLPLISKKIIVKSITLREPIINIAANKPAQEKEIGSSIPIPEKRENFAIELKSVSIEDATIIMKNIEGMDIYIRDFNANINNLSPNELSTIKISTNINLEQEKDNKKQSIFSGNIDMNTKLIVNKNKIIIKDLKLIVKPEKSILINLSEPLELSANAVYLIKTKQIMNANINLSSNFANFTLNTKDNSDKRDSMGLLSDFSLQMNLPQILDILQIKIAHKKMPQNIRLSGLLNYKENNLYLKNITGTIDNTKLTAYLNILSLHTLKDMSLAGKFNFDKIDLTPYLSTTATTKAQPAVKNARKTEETNIALPKELPNMNLEFNIDSLIINSIVLKKMHATITSKSGIYKLEPLSFTLATGGNFASNLSVDSKNNKYQMDIKANKINIGNFLQTYQGNTNINALAFFNAKFKTSGLNATKLKANLSGSGLFIMENIVLNSIVWMPKIFSGAIIPTKFQELSMPFVSKNGILSIKPIKLLEKKSAKKQKVAGMGNAVVNLPAESLKVKFDATFGKITIPIVISGPFSNLAYGLDDKKVLTNIIKSKDFSKIPGKVLNKIELDGKSIKNLFKGLMRE